MCLIIVNVLIFLGGVSTVVNVVLYHCKAIEEGTLFQDCQSSFVHGIVLLGLSVSCNSFKLKKRIKKIK